MSVNILLILLAILSILLFTLVLVYFKSASKLNIFHFENERLKKENEQFRFSADELRSRYENILNEKIKIESEKNILDDQYKKRNEEFEKLKNEFTKEFENLSNKIFEQKMESFSKQSKESLVNLLDPFKENINNFKQNIDEKFNNSNKEIYSFRNEVKALVDAEKKLASQAENLTKALKGDVKTQGEWGEIKLKLILEASGLSEENNDFILQGKGLGLKNDDGFSVQKPDVIINLPDGKHLIIDSKVSLLHYEKMVNSDDEGKKRFYQKELAKSFRSHVNNLASKQYHLNEKLVSPYFVLMFIPIDGVFSVVNQYDDNLYSYAWDKKVIPVTPSTLLATLKTVSYVWQRDKQNKNALEIANIGGKLYDKLAGFVSDMEKIGMDMGRAQKTYENAFGKLSTGRGNLLNQAEKLKKLGARANKNINIEFDENVTKVTYDKNAS